MAAGGRTNTTMTAAMTAATAAMMARVVRVTVAAEALAMAMEVVVDQGL